MALKEGLPIKLLYYTKTRLCTNLTASLFPLKTTTNYYYYYLSVLLSSKCISFLTKIS